MGNGNEANVNLASLENGIWDYIESRRRRVDSFVKAHFDLKESLHLHKQSAKKDFLKYPLNILFSIPLGSVRNVVQWFEKQGAYWASDLLHRIPRGLKTDYERTIENLILTELFEIPIHGPEKSSENSVLQHYLKTRDSQLEKTHWEEVSEYSASRAALTDLFASTFMFLIGWLLIRKMTSSILEISKYLAESYAHKKAVSHFFLGKGAGRVFYEIFPSEATQGEIIFMTLIITVIFVFLSYCANVFSDPLQKKWGMHQRKFHRALDSLEVKLLLHTLKRLRKTAILDCHLE